MRHGRHLCKFSISSSSFFSLFSQSICFVLFKVIFEYKFLSLVPKAVFFTKLAVSPLLVKFSRANLVVTFSAVNVLNSGVVIY